MGTPSDSSLQRLLRGTNAAWLGFDLLATVGFYLAARNARLLGTTWALALALVLVLAFGLAMPHRRARLRWLAGAFSLLTAIRFISTWTDSGLVTLFQFAGVWLLASAFVATAVGMVSRSLGVPWWPPQSQGTGRWLAIVMRPIFIFLVPMSCAVVAWGLRLSHRGLSCFGFTVASTVLVACLAPLGYLLAGAPGVAGVARRAITESLARRPLTRIAPVFLPAVYVWGLSIERKASRDYAVWTLLFLLSVLYLFIHLYVRHVELMAGEVTFTDECPWSRSILALHVLGILLLSLLYGDVIICILR